MDRLVLKLLFLHLMSLEVPASVILVPMEFSENPNYSFVFKEKDEITGNLKCPEEVRNDDIIKQSYSFVEPGESRRIVDYHSDSVNGFNVLVYKQDPQLQPIVNSQPLVNTQSGSPFIQKILIQDPNFLLNLRQVSLPNVQERLASAFKENNNNVMLTRNKDMLPPGYVPLVGKIDTPPGYSLKSDDDRKEYY